ncbi:MAG TPA: hypothetical protein VHY83_06260 [Solirubrobacteraceae bacterium]|nr:hypothetical protein [Solirubrobacteraceae bacterium]
MSYRPLAFVFGLTLGDYLLWNWSLNANHDVLALVSGLSLPPLALACAWMIALTLIRVVGGTTRRATASSRARAAARQAAEPSTAPATSAAGGSDAASASTAAQRSSSGKLAA